MGETCPDCQEDTLDYDDETGDLVCGYCGASFDEDYFDEEEA